MTKENAMLSVFIKRLANSTGIKPFDTSRTRHGMPIFFPQCLIALNAPGLLSTLILYMSFFKTIFGISSQNIILPSRNPPEISKNQ